MRNEIAYEAYMGFLMKSLFWISTITLIGVLILFTIDILFFLFAPRQKANVLRADIAPIGKKTKFIDSHSIFISYAFQYKNQDYSCQGLNSYGRVTVNGYYKALNIIQTHVIDGKITVYICPFNPSLSIVLPFKGLFASKLELLIIFLSCVTSAKILDYV